MAFTAERMDSDRGHILYFPVELLLIIFENLSNLDEPPCLAITCKKLYSLFQSHKRRIAWAIIRGRHEYIFAAF